MVTANQWVSSVLGATALSGLCYCVYFDYKRRNDPAFRRKLQIQRKELHHELARDAAAGQQAKDAMLRKAMALVKEQPIPTSPDEAHMFLQEQVGQGEMLFKSGHYPEAAACFFRAARVYPDPMHFMSILNNLLPEDLFQLVLTMLQRDTLGKSGFDVE